MKKYIKRIDLVDGKMVRTIIPIDEETNDKKDIVEIYNNLLSGSLSKEKEK